MGDQVDPTETKDETEPNTLPEVQVAPPPWLDTARRRNFLDCLRRGDRAGLVAVFHGDPKAIPSPVENHLAEALIEVRRANVAILGTAEAFVRHTPSGDLHQVIAPVSLSLADGTLYQIPERWEKVLRDDHNVRWNYKSHRDKRYDLVPVIPVAARGRASVSAEGLLRMNAVAGCSVALPPTVWIDGVERANPYVARDDDGDITRIVISCRVAGPTPTTGNLVVVQYVLDVDPRLDLLHMLAAIANKRPWKPDATPDHGSDDQQDAAAAATAASDQAAANKAVRLMSRADYNEWRKTLDTEDRLRWHWVRITGPIGYAHDLTNEAVARSYEKYLAIMGNAMKKAQTIARRNALKAHPALARHAVEIDANGRATIPIVGWTTRGDDLGRYTRALEELATRPDTVVIDATEVYDPAVHETGDMELDPVVVPDDPSDEAPAPEDPRSGDRVKRNKLLAELDDVAVQLRLDDLADLGYPPDPSTPTEQIIDMLSQAKRRIP